MAYEFIDEPVSNSYEFVDEPVKKQTLGNKIVQGVKQQVAGRSLGTYLKEEAQQTFSPIVGALGGISNVMEKTTGAAMDWAGSKLFGKGYGGIKGSTKQYAGKILQGQEQTPQYKIGEFVGETLPSIAATAGLGAPGGASVLSRLGGGAIRGGVQTQLANVSTEGKLATPTETAIGAGAGLFGQGIGEVAKGIKPSLYTKAFKQTQKGIAERGYELSGKTPGQLVMEQNLKPSVKKGLEQIKDKLGNTRKQVEATADKAGNIDGSSIRDGLKSDMIKQLGFDKLPAKAKSTQDMIDKVSNIVDDYIPDGNIKGNELVQQIKNINKTLPSKLIGMGIQDPTSNKGFSQALEKSLKKVLDEKAAAGGANAGKIQELYKTYGKQKTVQSILKDENLRKTLGRQLVGAGAGSAIGGIAGYEDFKEGNIFMGGLKVVAGALAGKKAMQLANNPTFLMKLGNIADKVINKGGKNLFQKGAAYLSSKIK